jgi:hypothetical protein
MNTHHVLIPTTLLALAALAPTQELRELSTDRPDTTESPYSVDKGHFQFEAELISWGRDKVDGVTTTELAPGVNLKVGISDNADLQVVVGYLRVSEDDGTNTQTVSGLDDVTIRLKYNLWGQDGGDQPTAGALMPFVTLPAHGDKLDPVLGDDASFGLIAPVGFSLPNDWGAAVMAELDFVRNSADDGWTTELLLSMTAAHDITDRSAGFVELVSISGAERNSTAEAYFDTGITYAITEMVQFDVGTNIGLTRDSQDLRLFSGLSSKF